MERSANSEWGLCASALHLSRPPRPPPKIAFPLFCAPLLSEFGYRVSQRPWIILRRRILPLIISANAFVQSRPGFIPRSVGLAPPLHSPPLHLFNFILASAISSDKITLADADADADDGNGIIPLNDCPSAPRGMSVAVRARSLCLVAAPPRRPGAVLAFRLLSFVLGENRERSRRSRFPPILGTDRPSARALQALVRHRAS